MIDELIERVERGEGADRELDACVAFAAGIFDRKLSYGLEHCRIERGERREDDFVEVIVRGRGALIYTEPYPRYTTSLDAVLALIEEKLPGWRDIESAPLNQSVQIFIPGSDYYGNRGVYAGILVDMGSGRRWMTFGWAVGRDLGPEMQPTMWRPFEPPSALLSAAGER